MKHLIIITLIFISKPAFAQFLDTSGNYRPPVWNIQPIDGLKAYGDTTLGIQDNGIDPKKINWKVSSDFSVDANGALSLVAKTVARRADTTFYGNTNTKVFYITWLTGNAADYIITKNSLPRSAPADFVITPGKLTLTAGIGKNDKIVIISK